MIFAGKADPRSTALVASVSVAFAIIIGAAFYVVYHRSAEAAQQKASTANRHTALGALSRRLSALSATAHAADRRFIAAVADASTEGEYRHHGTRTIDEALQHADRELHDVTTMDQATHEAYKSNLLWLVAYEGEYGRSATAEARRDLGRYETARLDELRSWRFATTLVIEGLTRQRAGLPPSGFGEAEHAYNDYAANADRAAVVSADLAGDWKAMRTHLQADLRSTAP